MSDLEKISLIKAILISIIPLGQLWARIFWLDGSLDKSWLMFPLFLIFFIFSLIISLFIFFSFHLFNFLFAAIVIFLLFKIYQHLIKKN